MTAILDSTRKRGFPQGGFGWGFIGDLHNPTESNSVEIPLLTFLSISNGPRSLYCLDYLMEPITVTTKPPPQLYYRY